jgi:hypothetical protein
MIEEALVTSEEYVVLDGVRALARGDEEAARQCFLVATASNPDSEAAWFWRARTSLTIEELIQSLERCVQLNPLNETARIALEQARGRHDLEVQHARAVGKALLANRRPRLRLRFPAWAREVSEDLACIACIALGLLWLGPLILPALVVAHVTVPANLVPSFALAAPDLSGWLAMAPAWAQPTLAQLSNLVATAHLGLLPHPWRIGAAFAYLVAAFYSVSDGWASRALVLVAGIAAVALLPYGTVVGPAYVAAALAALLFGILGSGIRLPARKTGISIRPANWSLLSTIRARLPRAA